ncbi:unnamed protein product [Orchesella dallaii]|uniref:O-acyltransferase WSD1 C-terminal domain-containing protein n=1 Tax=Orchesella dallaii TaxID=48710 RepID=A0ABP1RXY6_9HEXA
MAVELLPSENGCPPRTTICVKFVVDGKVTVEEMEEIINNKWLVNDNSYPELKQYVDYFMGFMFWKPDTEFNLKNHLKSHTLWETNIENQSIIEQKVCQFLEELLNKPFTPKRSPWEFYIINNYRNEQLKNQGVHEEMTLIVLRVHHALADGFSLAYAVIGDLFETPEQKNALPIPKPKSFWEMMLLVFTAIFRFPYELTNFIGLVYHPRTPLHTTDERRGCKLLYERNDAFPVQRIKEIKRKLGVSFSGVLLTAISAAVAKSQHELQRKKGGNFKSIERTPFGIPLPLSRNSKKLQNSWAGTYLQLPTKLELDSMERLRDVEEQLQQARKSIIPFMFLVLTKSVGLLFPSMTKYLTKNRLLPAGFSSFPGSGVDVYVTGKKVLMTDVLGGIHNGVTGVGFMILSFGSCIRVSAMAIEGTVNREELKKMLGCVQEEFDNLE